MDVVFFTGSEEFIGWLENFHLQATELWLGFYKKRKGVTAGFDYKSAVETALCYGWIDGKTQSIDLLSYKVRFTPRKTNSNWSLINIKRVEELTSAGLMHPSGLKAFENRKPEKSGVYSFEREHSILTSEMEAELKENKPAWQYFTSRSPGYKKTCLHWIMSAKQEVTRTKRLRILIDSSASGLRIPLLRNDSGQQKPSSSY